tara:strand:- start:304 stop:999 length:696 start_codon:yes stop_codon:yes gene_type:complete
MSTLNVDKVDPSTGTDLEIGTSGDTISIPSGATLDISASTLTPPATMPASSGVNFTALNASNLGSGTVPAARLSGVGKVLQVIQSTSTTGTTTASNDTLTDTDLTITITPATTSSKIKLTWWANTSYTNTGDAFAFFMDFKRAIDGGTSTDAIVGVIDSNLPRVYSYDTRPSAPSWGGIIGPNGIMQYLDSPSTAAEIVYTCQFRANAWSGSTGTEGFYENGIFIAEEIGA